MDKMGNLGIIFLRNFAFHAFGGKSLQFWGKWIFLSFSFLQKLLNIWKKSHFWWNFGPDSRNIFQSWILPTCMWILQNCYLVPAFWPTCPICWWLSCVHPSMRLCNPRRSSAPCGTSWKRLLDEETQIVRG